MTSREGARRRAARRRRGDDAELGDVFEPGDHGSTFAGGPVGAAAALAALDVLGEAGLLAAVRATGERFVAGLADRSTASPRYAGAG